MTSKILVLGVDAMDPRLTKKYVDMGLMPNVKQYIERGSCREDLVMLGAHPTVTPPMWTTLACGCYANVHGITAYAKVKSEKGIDVCEYNFDSHNCKAEQLWNVFAEAGKKTLVWHWPGSAWPPTSDSPNLMVVDGTSPGAVGMSVATIESDFMLHGSTELDKEIFDHTDDAGHAPCVVEGLVLENSDEGNVSVTESWTQKYTNKIITDLSGMETAATETPLNTHNVPIKAAKGWENAPADALEFSMSCSGGLIRYVGLILKNEAGIYDTVALYRNKKTVEPFVVLKEGVMNAGILGEAIKAEQRYRVNRNMKLLHLKPDGSDMMIYVSAAMDTENDSVFHPKRLHKEVIENIGYLPPTAYVGCQNPDYIVGCMWDCWNVSANWQAKALLYLVEHENLDVVFSHFHNVDLQAHSFIKHLAEHDYNRQPVEVAQKWMENVYTQTDMYVGQFLPLLDEGWTILIVSDHGQVARKNDLHVIGDCNGVTAGVMKELGFTVLKRDENGQEILEIDFSQTKAVANSECNIWINLKGRDAQGIVDPADQYELEEEIMTALYGYRDQKTGHRIISVALRNRDALVLGYGGPECGDICYWVAEGYNIDHADCLSTTLGEADTSVSPLFIGCGQGFKQNHRTNRVIRQIDIAPTVAVLGGVRFPAECEGAPIYQIFAEEI